MKKVHIVGIGIDPLDISPRLSEWIRDAQVIAGGRRQLDWFKDHPASRIILTSPIEEAVGKIKHELEQGKNVVVLADGDPMFFGIGTLLTRRLGKDNCVIHPNVTTLQAATARLGIPWHDIQIISLHGRKDIMPLLRTLIRNDRVAVLTDNYYHPARVAGELIRKGVDTFAMCVFENLSTDAEKIGEFSLEEAAGKTFSPLNFIMLYRIHKPDIPLHLGMDDDIYLHQRGMITKREVRAAGLAALEIMPHHIVWDLGSGSGSVAIEASMLAYNGTVFAVEKKEERILNIKKNIRRTGAYGVEAVHGGMPGCLEPLPDPDRIFIGGGMGKDNKVLNEAIKRLKPDGRLVLHLVLMGSLTRAGEYLKALNWQYSTTLVQVSRSKPMSGDQRLEAMNPIYILSATKPIHGPFI
ncbi:MAG: precorrin-6y C5,15-methyltransferase (decarboxylating) subunit CbiE [Thermodesulfobacteriota bacterium]|nr:precorrin-6y C5,15-methyltransferase (decarboxylating) subunit CbiE [Thermodesulfobacteriota bacterium]